MHTTLTNVDHTVSGAERLRDLMEAAGREFRSSYSERELVIPVLVMSNGQEIPARELGVARDQGPEWFEVLIDNRLSGRNRDTETYTCLRFVDVLRVRFASAHDNPGSVPVKPAA